MSLQLHDEKEAREGISVNHSVGTHSRLGSGPARLIVSSRIQLDATIQFVRCAHKTIGQVACTFPCPRKRHATIYSHAKEGGYRFEAEAHEESLVQGKGSQKRGFRLVWDEEVQVGPSLLSARPEAEAEEKSTIRARTSHA